MPGYSFDVRTPTFARLLDGTLPFHVVVDNWGYCAGDTACFVERHGQQGPTGRTLTLTITWVYEGAGMEPGYVVLGFGHWEEPT